MTKQKTRWGIIGCAAFARRRAIPAMLQTASVEVSAVASRQSQKAKEFADEFKIPKAYASYEELLADPDIDVIYNPLPNGMHSEWTIAALKQGKHVLCEKPFVVSSQEVQDVAKVISGTTCKVMEAFMWRFHPQHEFTKRAIADGAIGKIRLIRGAFTFTLEDKDNVRWQENQGGGCLLDVGAYPTSAARYYFADEPVAIYATGSLHPQAKVELSAEAIFEFKQGKALIDCAFDLPYRTDLEIVGEKGRIYLPKAWQPDEVATVFINDEPHQMPKANHYVLQFEHFSQSVINNQPPRFGLEDAAKQIRVIEAIRRSIRSGLRETI
jgi:predicted dehydrogenase